MARVAFLHVGPDTTLPGILVRSLREHNPDMRIVQCADRVSPQVSGVDDVLRIDADAGNLMTFRLQAFAGLAGNEPTLFLDTDMVCARPIDPAAELDDCDVAVCLREYNNAMPLDTRAMGINLTEYEGRTLGDVYPYLACAVIAKDAAFWTACLEDLRRLPAKFHKWFGDQEAMRNVIKAGGHKVGWLRESIYACLPDMHTDPSHGPKLFHFKGPLRKQMMIDGARQAGWLDPN